MEKRLFDSSPTMRQIPSRKKSSSRRSQPMDMWRPFCGPQNEQDGGLVSGMEYHQPPMLWQTNVPQNVPGNGQRLFAAMSDPSVCGYSPMPMTYTMQPVSLPPMYGLYQSVPLQNVRTVPHNKPRRIRNEHLVNVRPNISNNASNGCGSVQENGLESSVHIAHQNGDYASLPPSADSGGNGDELNSEHRRYSDPGLGPAKNLVHSDSEDSVGSGSSITTISRSNKLVLSLIEQITELKKYNNQLFKELNETKLYLENMKAELVQCKQCASSDYQPGMLSDLIREIREANKKCEEGLVTKVKSILDERYNQQAKALEGLKDQLAKMKQEKENSDIRVVKLEEELAAVKLSVINEGREIAAFEEETLALRRELQEARASRTLAENHAAKCVNCVVSRSITPVNFNTPCITSTPVRTALIDTCSLQPPVSDHFSTITQTMSTSVAPSTAPSILRSRSSEVAVLLALDMEGHISNGIDSEPMSIEDPPDVTRLTLESQQAEITTSCKLIATRANEVRISPKAHDSTKLNDSEGVQWLTEISCLNTSEATCDVGVTRKLPFAGEEQKISPSGSREELTDVQPAAKFIEVKLESTVKEKDIKVHVASDAFENQNDMLETSSAAVKTDAPSCHMNGQKHFDPCNERGSIKKSRRKKSAQKRSFSETDRSDKSGKSRHKNAVDGIPSDSSSSSSSSRRATSEKQDRVNENQKNRAISEVPEVAVIGGGSFVPKDLCSTRILTSRVLTAPSRATYTTAYI